MKMKHNKKRNTAFLYECLIKEMTKAVVRGELQKKQQIITDMVYNALTLTEKTDDVFDEKFRKIKDGYYDGDKKTVSSIHKETELMILNEGNDVGKLITY